MLISLLVKNHHSYCRKHAAMLVSGNGILYIYTIYKYIYIYIHGIPSEWPVFCGGTHVKIEWIWMFRGYLFFRQSHTVLNIAILCLSMVVLYLNPIILHHLVDGSYPCNPIIENVCIVLNSYQLVRMSQPSTVL